MSNLKQTTPNRLFLLIIHKSRGGPPYIKSRGPPPPTPSSSAPPTRSARGVRVCAAVPPVGQWGPRPFDNGSRVRANSLYCGFVGQIPGNGDWGSWLGSSFPERERLGKRGGGTRVSLREERTAESRGDFNSARRDNPVQTDVPRAERRRLQLVPGTSESKTDRPSN